ncbi:MAG TPA: pyruvate kinase [Burkholderiales bacterium]|nr:pyruvate kinase [Burkholderiales bacterium]
MLRRTKIVATLGPSTDDPKVFDALIEAGVDVVRLNFSHGTPEVHRRRAENARKRAEAAGRHVGVIVDLQGPKIRIGKFKTGSTLLKDGARFVLDAELSLDGGTDESVGITYKDLPKDVESGATLLLADGQLALRVDEVRGARIVCTVVSGGELSNNKGINRKGGGLSAHALTDQDREHVKVAAAIAADYLAVSFIRSAADVEEARALLRAAGGHGGIISKMERAEAIENAESIIKASDVIMVARGDLAVEIGDASVPPIQKRLIKMARHANKIAITATQMMESMIASPVPTRAEVSDVANAVLDGSDAVMLSAETASGAHPVEAVLAMDRVCRVAEQLHEATHSRHRMETTFLRIDEAVAMATMYAANHLPVKAIAALTESGTTPLWMSRIESGVPIYALASTIETRRKLTLYRGVYPIAFETASSDHAEVNRTAIEELRRRSVVTTGDLVIITKGDLSGVMGGTNAMKIATVTD